MEAARRRARLFLRKTCGNVVAACDRRQMPGEGQYVVPMAVLMKQRTDASCIARCKRLVERSEPLRGGTAGILRRFVATYNPALYARFKGALGVTK